MPLRARWGAEARAPASAKVADDETVYTRPLLFARPLTPRVEEGGYFTFRPFDGAC